MKKSPLNKGNILFTYSIVITVLFIFIFNRENYIQRVSSKFIKNNNSEHYLNNQNYHNRTDLFKIYKNQNRKVDIVMLGNSITQRVDWNELLDRDGIINRGIDGDITEGFLNRLDGFKNYNPKYCFIMGGINDLNKNVSIKTIIDNMERIIMELKRMNITPIIQSTLFVSETYVGYRELNDKVVKLNNLLKISCKNNSILFVDLNSKISNNNVLNSDYTNDGIHLNSLGYNKWKEILNPLIETLYEK